jgi:hypothetical protein
MDAEKDQNKTSSRLREKGFIAAILIAKYLSLMFNMLKKGDSSHA